MNKYKFQSLMIFLSVATLFGLSFARAEENSTDGPIAPAAASAPVQKAPAPAKVTAPVQKRKKVKVQKTQKKAGSTATLDQTEKSPAKKQTSLEVWLSKMKKKIAGTETKHSKLVAVASVRGDEQNDVPPLYWKGKSGQDPVTAPELKEFDEAINSAINGDNAIAKSKLENFVTVYPNSPLKEDAQETLRVIAEGNPVP